MQEKQLGNRSGEEWIVKEVRYVIFILITLLVFVPIFMKALGWLLEHTAKAASLRKLAQSRELIVISKLHVPARRFFRETAIYWQNEAMRQRLKSVDLDCYPETELWVIVAELKIIPSILSARMPVAVSREIYLQAAPGDRIENPHYRKINQNMLVDPIVLSLLR